MKKYTFIFIISYTVVAYLLFVLNIVLLKFNLRYIGVSHFNVNIDNPCVGPSEMTVCVTKGGNLRYGITYNVIWANQKTAFCLSVVRRSCNV